LGEGGDLRSSLLKTWPFWRTRARGSAMAVVRCVCLFFVVVVEMLVGVATKRESERVALNNERQIDWLVKVTSPSGAPSASKFPLTYNSTPKGIVTGQVNNPYIHCPHQKIA
jgi:hypothetical protein